MGIFLEVKLIMYTRIFKSLLIYKKNESIMNRLGGEPMLTCIDQIKKV